MQVMTGFDRDPPSKLDKVKSSIERDEASKARMTDIGQVLDVGEKAKYNPETRNGTGHELEDVKKAHG